MYTVLVISCHPDDMEIACAGTLLKCKERGDRVMICHLSSGNLGHVVIPPDELIKIRANEAARSAEMAGFEIIHSSFDDLAIYDNNKEARDKVVDVIKSVNPNFIITHDPDDYMPDHNAVSRLVFDASFTATLPNYHTKVEGAAKMVPIYYMDTLCGVRFNPTEYVDVSDYIDKKLEMLNCHPVRIISNEGHQDIAVTNVSAVNGNDGAAVAKVIAEADILATAVGVNVLKFIIPNLVAGIRLRKEQNGGPLNIIICENLMDANKVIEGMLKVHLNEEEQAWFDENIGLVEASIGRMVPVQTDAMKDGDPLRVCVESYGFLPVDKDAFKGEIPQIRNMVPFAPFDFYLKRKLYVHNMGHATCAYLGDLLGLEYIYQSIDRDEIYIIVRNAMEESARALSMKYGVALEDILRHITDLLHRFTNAALLDTCKRVGGDPKRKLSPADRLIGSASLALEVGVTPAYIAVGAAAGLKRYLNENDMEQNAANAAAVLKEVSELDADSDLAKLILSMYEKILSGCTIKELRAAADKVTAASMHDVI